MADNIEQAPATAELSAQEQISALRGDFVDLKTSLSDFLSQMKATQHPPPPPGRELPPHQQTQQPPPRSTPMNIRTFLSPREMYFASYKRMIIWVSLHFGFPPSERRRESSRSQNWFKSLIQQNAWDQNVTNPYADLERLPFILPALSSWDAFEDCLIESFADKFIAQSAKAALEACVQGSTSVDDYNSRFSSLVYLVNMGEHLRIDRYVKGLHIDIVSRVESPIWRAVPTLARKMRMASEAARDLEIIASLSAPNQSGKRFWLGQLLLPDR
ncbi:hypothetical protein H4Q26_010652 [Puccinia striiformis f. sp. tritici PST-130]|nr:hypothetical protein H4Q26_010652 [Puccinia striiformis f. sp. tritici PST-130]